MKYTSAFILSLIILSSSVFAWDDCPFGQVNDTYPSDCARYVDTNGDAICDKSQPEPSSTVAAGGYVAERGSGLEKIANLTGIPADRLTLAQVADYYKIDRAGFVSAVKSNFNLKSLTDSDLLLPIHDNYNVCADELMLMGSKMAGNVSENDSLYLEYSGTAIKAMSVSDVAAAYGIQERNFIDALNSEYKLRSISGSDMFQTLHDNYGVAPSRVKEIALSLRGSAPSASPLTVNANAAPQSQMAPASAAQRAVPYDYGWLTLLILLAYASTYLAAYSKRITMFLHRKIWNAFLALFALAVSLTGVYLVLKVNYGFVIEFPYNFLQVHVATGIAFVIIAVFHAAWHLPYFKGYLPRQKEDSKAPAKDAK